MLHLALGLFFLVLTVAAPAAEPEKEAFELKLDLLSIHSMHALGESPNRRPPSYRFGAGVALNDTRDVSRDAFVTSDTAPRNSTTEPKAGAMWASRNGWQMISGGDRLSLSPLLRFGSQEHRIDVKPRRRSLSIQYRHDFN